MTKIVLIPFICLVFLLCSGMIVVRNFPSNTGGTTILRPTSVGTADNFNNYGGSSKPDSVDEETADNDATYVYTSEYTRQTFVSSTTIPSDATNIIVTIKAVIKSISSGVTFRLTMYQGNWYDSSNMTSTTAYAEYSWEMSTNPATSSAWTVEEVNSLDFGVSNRQNGTELRLTQIYAEVTYD